MAGRYSRFYSNYIFRKKHQNVKKGTIWERDWVTIGAKHQLEKGKRPFFGDSGFLYTINNIPSTKKRHNYGKWIASWLYPDVENAKPVVNSVEVNYLSNDIRDFAYYGSCSELIRTSILNIIANYPAIIYTLPPSMDKTAVVNFPTLPVKYINKEDCCKVLSAEEYNQLDEEAKTNYYKLNPLSRAIGYRVHNPFNVDLLHSDLDYSVNKNVNLHRFFAITYNDFEITLHTFGTQDTQNLNGYVFRPSEYNIEFTDVYLNNINCPDNYLFQQIVKISLVEHCDDGREIEIVINGYQVYDEIVFTGGELQGKGQDMTSFNYGIHWFFDAKPKEEIIEEFRDSLSPFESLLIREDTLPLYKNTFLTPYETDSGMYYVYKDYIWPSKDGVIDISSPVYIDYITNLYSLGEKLDELWCDNLWRNMTHESIKNYDWTYTRTFTEGEEEDNILGGKRMENLIRIYGRLFDDLKRYVDGIKLSTRVTYDCFNNAPDAELSDKLDYMGWDVFSTIPVLYDGEELDEAIENSFVIINKADFNDQITVEDYEALTDEEKANYEFKAADLSLLNLEPVANWFYAINPINITPLFMDNHFMRQLSLSSKYIMKTKGTRHSIDMVMALFGLGNDGTDDFYELTERYHYAVPQVYDDKASQNINKLNHRHEGNFDEELYYEGIPIENTEMYNAKYIVPFYKHDKYYRGEFAFQSDGGWGADREDLEYAVHFKETLSYLKVAGNIHDLLSLNPYDVSNGDIYYVIDLHDIVDYDETITEETIANVTHFFVCNNEIFTEKISSWTNIEATDALYEKAMYLYNIISTDIGNNPHVGYGKYDLGQKYIEYMRHPFKYDLDNYVLDQDTSHEMWSVNFPEYSKDTGITIYNKTNVDDQITVEEYEALTDKEKLNYVFNDDRKVLDFISNSEKRDKFFVEILREKEEKIDYVNKHMFEMDIAERQQMVNRIADINAILGSVRYYYNDKVFILTNKVRIEDKTPETYKKYFFNVILQYLMQVIPSTAILVLKDFD